MTAAVIEVRDVTKYFFVERPFYKQLLNPFGARERICALSGVSFGIEAGEILGVVGPNGAGKTTLLRILADLLEADAGSITLCGQRLRNGNSYLRSKIGYVPSDERSFFWRLTGRENLDFFGRLYGLSGKEVRRRTCEILREFGFEKRAGELFRDYSSGMRKKVAVMRALLHRPSVVLLDEITNGLDLRSAKMVKNMVREYVRRRGGCAAVWSTHRLEEIAEVCDRVIMIEDGSISFSGFSRDFHNRASGKADYLLKATNMDGQYDAFYKQCCGSIKVDASRSGCVSKFVFHDISGDDFGLMVAMAVKDYGACVVFASRLE